MCERVRVCLCSVLPAGPRASLEGQTSAAPHCCLSTRGAGSWAPGEPPGGAAVAVLLPVLLGAAVLLSLTTGVSGPTPGGRWSRIYTRILPWGPVEVVGRARACWTQQGVRMGIGAGGGDEGRGVVRLQQGEGRDKSGTSGAGRVLK